MLRRIIHSAFVITLTAVAACSPADPPADLAITNVTVIDAVNGVRAGQNVVMNNGTIVTVAEPGSPVNAEQVVDGTGKYLIPGLWDFHVHLTYDDAFTDAMAGLFLSYGITSVRDTGGPLALLKPVVDRLEAEGAIAPRVFFAGPLLDGEYVVYDGVNRPELGIGNPDVETARENVAMLAEAGVDFVKIYEMISPEVFEALVSAANEHGLPMDGHVPLSMRARNVGPRVNSLEHLRNIEMDCAEEPAAL
ncbi:MAG: hydrolase, partial [Gemmatimonadales bacterium]|nr:hydrolase [Gemmatimonadales bacterium]